MHLIFFYFFTVNSCIAVFFLFLHFLFLLSFSVLFYLFFSLYLYLFLRYFPLFLYLTSSFPPSPTFCSRFPSFLSVLWWGALRFMRLTSIISTDIIPWISSPHCCTLLYRPLRSSPCWKGVCSLQVSLRHLFTYVGYTFLLIYLLLLFSLRG